MPSVVATGARQGPTAAKKKNQRAQAPAPFERSETLTWWTSQ
jgi:hypothetical protein